MKFTIATVALALQLTLSCGVYAQVVGAQRVEVNRAEVAAPLTPPATVAQTNAQSSPIYAPQVADAQQQHEPQPRVSQAMAFDRTGSLLKATLVQQPDGAQARLEQVSLFAVPEQKPRTVKRHDLITVIIREQSEISTDAKTQTSRDASIDARVTEFLKLSLNNKSLSGHVLKDPPSISASGNTAFDGEGKNDRTDSFTTRLSCEVVDVKPNGSLVLQGRRNIKVNDDEQRYLVSGFARAEDITPDNTILSTQLADFDLRREDKGQMHDATKQSGLSKILSFINPF